MRTLADERDLVLAEHVLCDRVHHGRLALLPAHCRSMTCDVSPWPCMPRRLALALTSDALARGLRHMAGIHQEDDSRWDAGAYGQLERPSTLGANLFRAIEATEGD